MKKNSLLKNSNFKFLAAGTAASLALAAFAFKSPDILDSTIFHKPKEACDEFPEEAQKLIRKSQDELAAKLSDQFGYRAFKQTTIVHVPPTLSYNSTGHECGLKSQDYSNDTDGTHIKYSFGYDIK